MRNFVVIGLSLLSLNAYSIDIPWRDYSDPNIMSKSFERKFDRLPLHGATSDTQKLWASDYWPTKRGSINYRWNSVTPVGFDLVSPSRADVMNMTQEQLATLAPSEKLDILNGDYNYSLRKHVEANSSKSAALWNGICHGWAPASINHNEPLPKTLVNPDGIQIPFGSSDIKGLLSYYYAFKHDVETTHQMGRRCNINFGSHCDQDLNAGAFHIVLTNKVGLEQSSFVADVERFRQVWNHAVNEYTTIVLRTDVAPERDSAPGTVRRILVKTDMTFVLEIKKNNWGPVLGTEEHVNDVRNYEYILDIDAAGNIIGGDWVSKARPDFIWTMAKATTFNGNFSRLSELLND